MAKKTRSVRNHSTGGGPGFGIHAPGPHGHRKSKSSGGTAMPGSGGGSAGGGGGRNTGGTRAGGRHGPRHTAASGGVSGSMQHLASKLAKARNKKQISGIYRKALK